jgi:hypothetical protein
MLMWTTIALYILAFFSGRQITIPSAIVTVLVGIGELLVPTSGALGLLLRVALFAAYPLALLATGFFTAGERRWLVRLRHPSVVIAGIASLRAQPAAVDGQVPEAYEAEQIDEDARL